jgi:hypothetical protein
MPALGLAALLAVAMLAAAGSMLRGGRGEPAAGAPPHLMDSASGFAGCLGTPTPSFTTAAVAR